MRNFIGRQETKNTEILYIPFVINTLSEQSLPLETNLFQQSLRSYVVWTSISLQPYQIRKVLEYTRQKNLHCFGGYTLAPIVKPNSIT
ncbi:hypothetical protein MtrunA17_Chr7g0223341 [Medicago truncatula]|uniref:Uncharacterized protein n=1 Tax=Medicago truncatula TaxID=3880 RepID=A0A396GUI5_MEDTR|nr:hypothetical protein MtrunA17_Chr7g0223341 [Medicago truncatula]